ncbi:hypothetical protein HanIR_Chr01g0016511 [Helianthus annuus]|nr:hypothetical protein HanIR_Chr01g0016511 [Helianthus annuus]
MEAVHTAIIVWYSVCTFSYFQYWYFRYWSHLTNLSSPESGKGVLDGGEAV